MDGVDYLTMKYDKEDIMKNKISFIEIENFKTFDKLKIDGLKRVNLISGKNNLGKTAVLEAIRLNVSSINPQSLVYSVKDTLNKRNNNVEFDFFKDKAKKISFITDIRNIGMEFDKKLTPQILDLTIDKSIHKIKIGDFFQGGILINQYTLDKTNFIATKSIDINYLSNIYTNIFNLGKDEILDNYLKNFDDNIKSVRLINSVSNIPTFKVKLNNKVEPVLLNSLGDGINRFMAIICAIWSSKDGFLFIDEVENGIHYTNLEKLWKIIFEVSEDANCQVFATTHSKECIEAFNRENEEDNGTFIELYKNKKDEIVAKTRDFEQLDYSLTHGGSFRGE
mgnify:FL=1